MNQLTHLITISLFTFVAIYMFIRYGVATILYYLRKWEAFYDRVLRQQLLLAVKSGD